MTADLKEDYFMLEALKLAKKGAGRVSPNPMVGAVVVKNGKIIGKGYHRFTTTAPTIGLGLTLPAPFLASLRASPIK